MAQISKTSFNGLYGSSGTIFPDNTTGAISEADIRQFGQDISDSFLSLQDNVTDDDTMATATASNVPTGESIKAYVDGVTSVKRARVQITGGPSTRSIGTSPQTVLATPGVGFWYNIISVSIAYDYGAAAYNFGASSDIIVRFNGETTSGWRMNYSIMNGGANFQRRLAFYTPVSTSGLNAPENTKLELGTTDNANATTGDGDIQVIVTYTIEAINS